MPDFDHRIPEFQPPQEPETAQDSPQVTPGNLSGRSIRAEGAEASLPGGLRPGAPPGSPGRSRRKLPAAPLIQQRVTQQQPTVKLDSAFIMSADAYDKAKSSVTHMLKGLRSFDTQQFLIGRKAADPKATQRNADLLSNAGMEVLQTVSEIAADQQISRQAAFKQLVGAIDRHDQEAAQAHREGGPVPASSFALRCALLDASHKSGAGLDSWMVFTGAGKPEGNIWPFLEDYSNWVPESQAAMAKFTESTYAEARALAGKNPEKQVVLLKGGFGAGKTRQAKQLYEEAAGGVVAPDKGKEVVRRSMPSIPHGAAHHQGSQVAFGLFDEMIDKVNGSVVYDSSLSRPSDLESYITKAQKAGKKVVVYDVARHDMARVLSVLRRPVIGEDPRVPPKFIIDGAVRDKMNRAGCMELILDAADKGADLNPEYHFIGGNAQGWDTQEVARLTPGGVQTKSNAEERMGYEGLKYDPDAGTITSEHTEDSLRAYFDEQFERPVSDIVEELSPEEKTICTRLFESRVLVPEGTQREFTSVDQLDQYLATQLRGSISKDALEQAFDSVSDDARDQFLANATKLSAQGKAVTYLDLPLRVALTIHQNLSSDPWSETPGAA